MTALPKFILLPEPNISRAELINNLAEHKKWDNGNNLPVECHGPDNMVEFINLNELESIVNSNLISDFWASVGFKKVDGMAEKPSPGPGKKRFKKKRKNPFGRFGNLSRPKNRRRK